MTIQYNNETKDAGISQQYNTFLADLILEISLGAGWTSKLLEFLSLINYPMTMKKLLSSTLNIDQ